MTITKIEKTLKSVKFSISSKFNLVQQFSHFFLFFGKNWMTELNELIQWTSSFWWTWTTELHHLNEQKIISLLLTQLGSRVHFHCSVWHFYSVTRICGLYFSLSFSAIGSTHYILQCRDFYFWNDTPISWIFSEIFS